MYRLFLSLVACATAAACSSSNRPAEAPAPVPATATAAPDTVIPRAETAPLTPPGSTREFRGAYTRGFEASWFAPCEAPIGDALWWVTLTEDARLQRDSMLAKLDVPPTGALAVRWRGTISERMRAGHMGRGTRYMLVSEILEVRPLPGNGGCGSPSRAS
jgi:hypothetical protein